MKKISIYDNDLNNYLLINQAKEHAFFNYLMFRGEEFIGEWWKDNEVLAPMFHKIFKVISEEDFNYYYNKLFELWATEVSRTKLGQEFVSEDISACNFEIV